MAGHWRILAGTFVAVAVSAAGGRVAAHTVVAPSPAERARRAIVTPILFIERLLRLRREPGGIFTKDENEVHVLNRFGDHALRARTQRGQILGPGRRNSTRARIPPRRL